jgi:hypothetical protein
MNNKSSPLLVQSGEIAVGWICARKSHFFKHGRQKAQLAEAA